MAKKKCYPKKPKKSASVQTMRNYLAKCKDVDKHNAQIVKDAKLKESLYKQIQSKRQSC
jgi:hypothetical protein